MKNSLITVGILFALCGFSAAQSSNANIGGVNFGTGAATPAACVAPSYFTNTTTKVYSVCGSGGTYIAIGTSGTFAPLASPAFTGNVTVPNGTACSAGNSGLVFTTNTAGIWYDQPGGTLGFCLGGTRQAGIVGVGVQVASTGIFGFATSTVATAYNLGLSEDAAGILDVGTGAVGSKAGLIRSGNTVRVASNFTTINNTSLQAITGLTWTFPAVGTQVFSFHCHGSYSIATGAVAVGFGIQAVTAAPTNIEATGEMYTAAAVATQATLATLASTTATQIVAGTPGSTGVNNAFDLYGTIENPAATANTYNIMVSTGTGTDVVTVLRGAFCTLQ